MQGHITFCQIKLPLKISTVKEIFLILSVKFKAIPQTIKYMDNIGSGRKEADLLFRRTSAVPKLSNSPFDCTKIFYLFALARLEKYYLQACSKDSPHAIRRRRQESLPSAYPTIPSLSQRRAASIAEFSMLLNHVKSFLEPVLQNYRLCTKEWHMGSQIGHLVTVSVV